MEDSSTALIAQTLGSIDERMRGMDGKLDNLIAVTSDHSPRIIALERRADDHTARIRVLEEKSWSRAGLVAAVSGLTGVVVAAAAVASGHPSALFG